MKKRIVLLIDAGINFILGILLLTFSPLVVSFLGVPSADNHFYPTLLGGIFVGITIALVIEAFKKQTEITGLGLVGAVCINISGGLVLLFWLLFGHMELPQKGFIFLWTMDVILLIISSVELFVYLRKK